MLCAGNHIGRGRRHSEAYSGRTAPRATELRFPLESSARRIDAIAQPLNLSPPLAGFIRQPVNLSLHSLILGLHQAQPLDLISGLDTESPHITFQAIVQTYDDVGHLKAPEIP
jgi:hypothetical protein